MISQLHETNTGTPLSLRLVHCGHHQLTTDALVLHLWIDRDRPEADDWRAEIDEVATQQATVILRDYTVKLRMAQQQRRHAVCGLRRVKIWREVVPISDTLESRIHDRRNGFQIISRSRTNSHRHDGLRGDRGARPFGSSPATPNPHTIQEVISVRSSPSTSLPHRPEWSCAHGRCHCP